MQTSLCYPREPLGPKESRGCCGRRAAHPQTRRMGSSRGRGGTASAAPAARTDLPRLSNKSPRQLPQETRGPQQGQITAKHPHRGPRPGEAAPAPGLDPEARRPTPPPLPECHPALLTPRSSSERKSGPSSEPSCWAQRGGGGGAGHGRREGGRQGGGETKRTG